MLKKIIFFILFASYTFTSQDSAKLNDFEPVHILAAINFPINQINPQDLFTQEIFKNIDETFGSQGINVDQYQLEHIKKTYLYLIFLTKFEKVTKNQSFKKYEADFTKFLENNNQASPLVPNKDLVNSNSWLQVTIDSTDIANSTIWQLFCKSMITDINSYLIIGLKLIHNCEKQEFNYIPHFETSYYNQDYVKIRNINAVVRIKIELEQLIQQRYLNICNDWKKYSKATSKSISELEKEIILFQKTNFYQKTHNMHNLMGTQTKFNKNQKITQQDLLSAPLIQSPLKEYVFAFFLLYELYGQLTSMMHEENLDQIITICSSSKLSPNIFPYRPDDYILISELLAGKNIIQDKPTNSIHPTITTFKPEDLRDLKDWINPTRRPTDQYIKQQLPQAKSVQAQSFLSFLSDIGHDIVSAADDIKNGVEKACYAVKDLAESAAFGIAGFVLTVGADTTEGNKLMKESTAKIKAATHNLESSVDDFGSSIKEGIAAPVGELVGDVVGFITDDKKIGADIDTVITNCADALVNIAESALNTAAAGLIYVFMLPVQITAALIETMVAGIVAIWSHQASLDICHSILRSLVTTFMMVAQVSVQDFHVIMSSLGTFINSITTLFNDLLREITVVIATGGIDIFTSIANASGAHITTFDYANKAADIAYNTINQHRAIINQVVGVAVMIGADIATGGAATEAEAAAEPALEAALDEASDQTANAVADAQSEVDTTQEAVNAAQSNLETMQAIGNPEDIETAEQGLAEAQNKLETAEQTLSKLKKPEAPPVDQPSIPLKQQIANKLEDAINAIKTKAKDLQNLFTNNTQVAKEAGENLENQETTLNELNDTLKTQEGALEKDPDNSDLQKAVDDIKEQIARQEKEVKNARDYARETKKIANETPKEKALRYATNVFSPIGMFMNIAFNFTSIIGGYNQDQKNLLQQKEQEKSLQSLWRTSTESKISTAHTDLASLDEIAEKQKASIGNQILGVALSQNYSYANLKQFLQTVQQTLATLYAIELYPNSNTGLIPANVGTSWGLISDYLNLYPSEGFYVTTTGRTEFPYSQEIAQAPHLLTQKSTKKIKQWFNQRCTGIDSTSSNGILKKPTDPLTVHINFKILYTLNSEFYAGIYLAGGYHDYFSKAYLAALMGTTVDKLPQAYAELKSQLEKYVFNLNMININESYLAKMVVIYRKTGSDLLNLGVYEQNLTGKEWILQLPLPATMQLNHDHTYNLKAELNGMSLKITFWADDNPETMIKQTIPVTPVDNQRMYGIIASSAAIEWNQITPTIDAKNASVRKKVPLTPEATRNKENKLVEQQALNQIFGGKVLTLISKHRARIFGQYIYACVQTDIAKILSKNPADLLVFATNNNGSITDIGKTPNSFKDNGTNVLVSLITGHVFDQTWNCIATIPKVWQNYSGSKSEFKPFLPTLQKTIEDQQKLVFSKLLYINFGPSFQLNAIDITALENNTYLYTCNQTLRDSSGQPFTDYLVFAPTVLATQPNVTLGLPPTASNATNMVSLITGNVYEKNTKLSKNELPAPISTISSTDIANYLKQNLSAYSSILFKQTAQYQSAAEQTQPPVVTQNITSASIQGTLAVKKNWFKQGTTFHLDFNFAKLNLADRQKQAAASYSIQMNPSPKV